VIPEATPEFVCAMEEVLDVYERPYDPLHPVVGVDESPQQLVKEVRKSFTDSKGVAHVDYEYSREGAADIFVSA
jgi:cystathionine beta-lyase family protein involved in aluminum resistance